MESRYNELEVSFTNKIPNYNIYNMIDDRVKHDIDFDELDGRFRHEYFKHELGQNFEEIDLIVQHWIDDGT